MQSQMESTHRRTADVRKLIKHRDDEFGRVYMSKLDQSNAIVRIHSSIELVLD